MDAESLRRAFTGFFVARQHAAVPSSGLVPHHPTAPLLTNAGMNQFIPYFLGEEPPPWPRATSVQKCFRTQDIDIVGTTSRHLTFFEMLGNFSFGDYFKTEAVEWAWELVTEVLGLPADRLWATVHLEDDDAERIWLDAVGLPADRVQRMGDDNWWAPGRKTDPGPCGPCSEIFFDKGDEFGPPGGPAGGGPERYVEIWNLVFMQFNRRPDGSLAELPRKNIDTGAGLERILPILQGTASVFSTDVLRPVVQAAEEVTARRYGDDETTDVSLRILADHARAMTFLVGDGVRPSNEGREYVLRRIIRRAVRHAFQLGVERLVTPVLVEAVVSTMGTAYPELVAGREAITKVVEHEESRFRRTLESGIAMLEEALAGDAARVDGDVAFRLHDTYGFPIDLTREIAEERGVEVDLEGFEAAMAEQRRRARMAGPARAGADELAEAHRDLLERFGPSEFTGYSEHESKVQVLAVLPAGDGKVEIFLDRTPFYAESGGQVGDTGTISTESGRAVVVDTDAPAQGLYRHLAEVVEGEIHPRQDAAATIDSARREAIRRNHTGTHLLHWALREVLGAHVRQHGSLVGPDYLRFDFSHGSPVAPEELEQVHELVNAQVIANEPVRAYETSRRQAEVLGALAFFGERYGDIVRVVEAGSHSLELCGGTHVAALGSVGPVAVTTESSIGSNLRRVFALTGPRSLERARDDERTLERLAAMLRTDRRELPDAVARMLERGRSLEAELKAVRAQVISGEARRLAAGGSGGVVVARRDGLAPDQLRELAIAVRGEPGVRAVVIGGSPDGSKVSLVAAVEPSSGLEAPALVAEPARLVGGGGGGKGDVAVAGGRDAARLDEALAAVRERLSRP